MDVVTSQVGQGVISGDTSPRLDEITQVQKGRRMPLKKGTHRDTISRNISEMKKAGRPVDQAIAAALDTARRSGAKIPKKKGRSK